MRGARFVNTYANFFSESAQPGCAQSQEISVSPFASSQRWLQYSLSPATVHLQAGCAHFFCSILAMVYLSKAGATRASESIPTHHRRARTTVVISHFSFIQCGAD
jgi:hypothetical protein